MPRTVLIVDDDDDFRRLAGQMLELCGYLVVGEEGDAVSAVRAARALRPDVLLLDVQLGQGNGFDVAAELREDGSKIVLVSSREAADYATQLSTSTACGFIAKRDLSGAAMSALLGPPG